MTNQPDQPLSREELAEVGGRVANISAAGLPLAAGLLALSEEAPAGKLRNTLLELSRRLDAGESLQSLMSEAGSALPEALRGVVQAGLRTGCLGPLLGKFLSQTRDSLELRRRTLLSIAYPAILLTAAGLIFAFLGIKVIPEFTKIFSSFGVNLPPVTVTVIEFSNLIVNYGVWIVLGLLIGLPLAWELPGRVIGLPFRRRLVCAIPVIGPMFRFAALTDYCSMLAGLVKHQVSLPEALRIAGLGTPDAEIEQGSVELAARIEKGERLADAAFAYRQFPPSLQHAFRWEGNQEAFVDFIEAAGQIFKNRTEVQMQLLKRIGEPLVQVSISFMVAFIVVAMFAPLIKLLNDLS